MLIKATSTPGYTLSQRNSQEFGAIFPLLAISLLTLISLVAFVANVGMVSNLWRSNQENCDAAALAAIGEYQRALNNGSTFSAAYDSAVTEASTNRRIEKSGFTQASNFTYDVTPGLWRNISSDPSPSGSPSCSPEPCFAASSNTERATALKVTCSTVPSSPISLLFGKILGTQAVTVKSTSVARLFPRMLISVLDLSRSMVRNDTPWNYPAYLIPGRRNPSAPGCTPLTSANYTDMSCYYPGTSLEYVFTLAPGQNCLMGAKVKTNPCFDETTGLPVACNVDGARDGQVWNTYMLQHDPFDPPTARARGWQDQYGCFKIDLEEDGTTEKYLVHTNSEVAGGFNPRAEPLYTAYDSIADLYRFLGNRIVKTDRVGFIGFDGVIRAKWRRPTSGLLVPDLNPGAYNDLYSAFLTGSGRFGHVQNGFFPISNGGGTNGVLGAYAATQRIINQPGYQYARKDIVMFSDGQFNVCYDPATGARVANPTQLCAMDNMMQDMLPLFLKHGIRFNMALLTTAAHQLVRVDKQQSGCMTWDEAAMLGYPMTDPDVARYRADPNNIAADIQSDRITGPTFQLPNYLGQIVALTQGTYAYIREPLRDLAGNVVDLRPRLDSLCRSGSYAAGAVVPNATITLLDLSGNPYVVPITDSRGRLLYHEYQSVPNQWNTFVQQFQNSPYALVDGPTRVR